MPGDSSASAWKGFHAFEDLIRVVNPSVGYMHNCNVAPDAMAHVPLVRAQDVPSAMFHARPGDTHTRGLRATELLAQHTALTRDQAFAIVADTQIPQLGAWKRLWKEIADAFEPSSPGAALHHELLQWNGRVDKNSTGATAFEHLIEALLDLGGWGKIGPVEIQSIETLTPDQRTFLIRGVRQAAERMEKHFKSVSVPWGRTHRVVRGGSWPVDGAGIRFGPLCAR